MQFLFQSVSKTNGTHSYFCSVESKERSWDGGRRTEVINTCALVPKGVSPVLGLISNNLLTLAFAHLQNRVSVFLLLHNYSAHNWVQSICSINQVPITPEFYLSPLGR